MKRIVWNTLCINQGIPVVVVLIIVFQMIHPHRVNSLPICSTSEILSDMYDKPNPVDEQQQADFFLQIAGQYSTDAKYDSSTHYYNKAKYIYRSMEDWGKYITCLNGIGHNLTVQGEYKQAEDTLEKALSYSIKHFGEHYDLVAQSLNNLGRVNVETGNYDTALELHKRALTVRRSLFGETHLDVAHSYNNIGVVYWFKGERYKVEEYFTKTLALRRELLTPPHPDIAGSLLNMGFVYRDRGDYRTAIEYYEEALEMRKELHGSIHPSVASAYLTLGGVYRNLEYLDIAEEYYREALSIRQQIFGTRHPSVAQALQSIARVYRHRRDPVMGLSYAQQAYDMVQTMYGENHPLTADLSELIGDFHRELGNLDLAEKYFTIAFNGNINRFGEYHSATVFSLLDLASIERLRNNYKEALRYLERARDIQIQMGDAYALSSVYHAISKVFEEWGEYERAAQEIRTAIDILKENPAGHDRDLGDYYMHLGYHKIRQGNYSTGLAYLQQGLIELVPGFSGQSVYTNPDIANSLSDRYLLDVFNRKADALVSYFRNVTGDVRDLEAALDTYERASALIDKMRTGISTENAKFLLSEKSHGIYESAIQVCIDLYTRRNDRIYLEKAFSFTEKNRAVALWEALTESNARTFSGIPDSLLQLEQTLRNELAYYQIELQHERRDSITLAKFQNRYHRMYTDLEDLIILFEREFPDYYKLKYQSDPVSIEELQTVLDDSEALLQYYFGQKSIVVFTVTHKSVDAHSVEIDESLEKTIRDFSRAIRRIDREQFLQTGKALYDVLIGPTGQLIRNVNRLIIIPDGTLYHIPFEALVSDVTVDNFSGLPFLLKEYTISYHYSSTLYYTIARTPDSIDEPEQFRFAGFAPVFDENLPGGYIVTSTGQESAYRGDDFSEYWFEALPYSKEEIQGILTVYEEHNIPATGYFYNRANKRDFIEVARNYKILHIASHGFVNETQPDLSGILLAASPPDTSLLDGIVYAGELYNLDVRTDLVVLSSCESGTGDIIRGEGLMAMTRGFLYSGAQNMIVSLWKVFDRQTKDLMIAFYRSVLSGNTYAEALRDAKLLMLEDELTAFPHLWSGFILIGR